MLHGVLGIVTSLAWVVFLVSVASAFWRRLRQGGIGLAMRLFATRQLLVPLVLMLGLSFVKAGLVFIYPQQIGVVVSIPSANGVREQPLESGLRWVWPLLESVVIYPRYWQTYTMSARQFEGQRADSDAIATRTRDNQEVSIDLSIIYRIDPKQAVAIHLGWQNRYAEELLRPAVRGFLRREVARFTVGQVNSTQRAMLADELNVALKVIALENGLIVKRALLRNIGFTSEYATAVERKQVALEGRERKQHEAAQIANLAQGQAAKITILAQAEAAAILLKAQARADARIIQAHAEAQALELVGLALQGKQELLTYRYITKLSPDIQAVVLPHDMPLIFPLPGMKLPADASDSPFALGRPVAESLKKVPANSDLSESFNAP